VAGVAGLILAGGLGSRFGGPKAWALLPDGLSFLDVCTASLRAAGASPVAATLPPGTDDPMIDGLVAVPLPGAGLDMFASLRIGLQRLVREQGWTRVAVLPVDHPLVRSATIIALAAAAAPAVIPRHRGKHGHPVVIDRASATAMADGVLTGPTLREVLHEIGAVDIEIDDPGVVANCNTPDSLASALASLT